MTTYDEYRLERRLRHRADRLGLRLVRSRSSDRALFGLTERLTGAFVTHGLSLDQVEAYLASRQPTMSAAASVALRAAAKAGRH
jgi:hypothetical protein